MVVATWHEGGGGGFWGGCLCRKFHIPWCSAFPQLELTWSALQA